jgi:hypothetical protein
MVWELTRFARQFLGVRRKAPQPEELANILVGRGRELSISSVSSRERVLVHSYSAQWLTNMRMATRRVGNYPGRMGRSEYERFVN